jgi:ABC-type nitrate/sulfonate/bicarbonate transport system substrate-binding protein
MRFRSNVGWLIALFVLLAGCGTATTPTVVPTPAPVDTSIQLSWFHSIEFAGIYEIAHQNYGAQSGLNLRVDGGGFDASGAYIDPVAQVVSGKAEFGVAGADVLLRARAAGQPVVAIAAIYQRSPVGLISLKESNINRPADLAGKKVGIAPPGTTVYISYHALLNAQKIDPASITEVPEAPETSVPDLLSKKIDVLQTFITHEAIQAKAQRDDINVMVLSDYGIDLYSNVVFTTEKMIADKPAVVAGLVKALSQGLQWSVDHPKEAAAHVVADYAAVIPPPLQPLQEPGMLASVPLIKPAGSQPGMMSAKVWEATLQTLIDQKIITDPVDVNKAYNLTFIGTAAGQ